MRKPGYGVYIIVALLIGVLLLVSYIAQRLTEPSFEEHGHEHAGMQMANG